MACRGEADQFLGVFLNLLSQREPASERHAGNDLLTVLESVDVLTGGRSLDMVRLKELITLFLVYPHYLALPCANFLDRLSKDVPETMLDNGTLFDPFILEYLDQVGLPITKCFAYDWHIVFFQSKKS